jgi:hypothetical protein
MRQTLTVRKYLLLNVILGTLTTCATVCAADHPTLNSVKPDAGVTTPGNPVSIHGSGFTPDTVVYFEGLQTRETSFISPTTLDVVTPYLRPGHHRIQLKTGDIIINSETIFTALPSQVDSQIDRAILMGQEQVAPAIEILTLIAKTNIDYQVRAFAHYQAAEIYFAHGDWWQWRAEAFGIFDDANKSGRAVQTSWRYRVAIDQSDYLLDVNPDPQHDLVVADWTVQYDATQNPEPRFFRSLVSARYGKLLKAKADSDSILKLEPSNQSYRALAAYVAVLSGDKARLQSLDGEPVTDGRALSLLGEAAYLSGDLRGAQSWWAQAAKAYPLGASLAYWAGKKHFALGQQRVAEALLTECLTMAPDSKEAKEARDLLATPKPH